MTATDKPVELTENVLEAVKKGQQAAIESVRLFVSTVEKALPAGSEGASKRQDLVDSALEMADKLVGTQYDFLRSVVRAAGNTLGGGGGPDS